MTYLKIFVVVMFCAGWGIMIGLAAEQGQKPPAVPPAAHASGHFTVHPHTFFQPVAQPVLQPTVARPVFVHDSLRCFWHPRFARWIVLPSNAFAANVEVLPADYQLPAGNIMAYNAGAVGGTSITVTDANGQTGVFQLPVTIK